VKDHLPSTSASAYL